MTPLQARVYLFVLLSWPVVVAIAWIASAATGGATTVLTTIAAVWTGVAWMTLIKVLETP